MQASNSHQQLPSTPPLHASPPRLPSTPPLRSSPHLWPTRPTAPRKPSTSFSRATRELSSTLAEALDFFKPFYTDFREETKDVQTYADDAVIDQVWAKKILSRGAEKGPGGGEPGREEFSGRGRERDRDGNGDGNGDVHLARFPRPPSRRLQPLRGPPGRRPAPSSDETDSPSRPQRQQLQLQLRRREGLEAAAHVAKMSRCREDLFPSLRRRGRRRGGGRRRNKAYAPKKVDIRNATLRWAPGCCTSSRVSLPRYNGHSQLSRLKLRRKQLRDPRDSSTRAEEVGGRGHFRFFREQVSCLVSSR